MSRSPSSARPRRHASGILTAMLALLLAACAGVGDFPDQVGRAYHSVDAVRNQALVQNILRASRHRPLSFATITNVTGQANLTGGFGVVSVPFGVSTGPHGAATITEPFSGQVSNTTGYNVAVLDSREFYRGLLEPLNGATVNFMVQQGFPRDVLFDLFIDHVEERDPQGGTVVSVNAPDDPSFPRFQASLKHLLAEGLTTRPSNRIEDAGPPIPAAQLYDARRLAAIAKAGALVRPLRDGRYQVFLRHRTAVFCFDPALASRPITDPSLRAMICDKTGGVVTRTEENGTIDLRGARGSRTRIVTRSIRGIFSYLGELVGQPPQRQVYVAAADPEKARAGVKERLFDIQTTPPPGGAWLTTRFEGATYYIPFKGGASTTRVIGAIIELQALNTTINALPQNNTVTIFGH